MQIAVMHTMVLINMGDEATCATNILHPCVREKPTGFRSTDCFTAACSCYF